MIFQLAAELSDNQTQIEIAIISSLTAIIAALITALFARRFINPKTPEKDPDVPAIKTESPLDSYSGDRNDFMALVIQDSKLIHARLDKNEKLVDQLQELIKTLRDDRIKVVAAFGRYIRKLASAWGSGGTMPSPDEEDMALLEETLPVDWRRRTK